MASLIEKYKDYNTKREQETNTDDADREGFIDPPKPVSVPEGSVDTDTITVAAADDVPSDAHAEDPPSPPPPPEADKVQQQQQQAGQPTVDELAPEPTAAPEGEGEPPVPAVDAVPSPLAPLDFSKAKERYMAREALRVQENQKRKERGFFTDPKYVPLPGIAPPLTVGVESDRQRRSEVFLNLERIRKLWKKKGLPEEEVDDFYKRDINPHLEKLQKAYDWVGDYINEDGKHPEAAKKAQNALLNISTAIPLTVLSVMRKSQYARQSFAKVLTVDTNMLAKMAATGIAYGTAATGIYLKGWLDHITARITANPEGSRREMAELQKAYDEQQMPNKQQLFNNEMQNVYTLYDKNGNEVKQGSASEKIMNVWSRWGLDPFFKELGDSIIGDNPLPEDDRDFVENWFKFSIELGMPVMGLPMFGWTKFARKTMKPLDDFFLRQHAKNEGIKLFGDTEGRKIINELLRKNKKGQGLWGEYDITHNQTHIIFKGKKHGLGLGATAKGEPYTHKINRGKLEESFGIVSAIGRSTAAGYAGATTTMVMQDWLGDDFYNQYKWVPYLFSMAGYMGGARGMSQIISKTPGAAYPLMKETFGSIYPPLAFLPPAQTIGSVYTLAGIVLRIGRGLSTEGGKPYEVWAKSLEGYANKPFGKFLQAYSSGVELSTALKAWKQAAGWDTVKQGPSPLDVLLAQKGDKWQETRMTNAAVNIMMKSFRSMDEESRELIIGSTAQFMKLVERLNIQGGEKSFLPGHSHMAFLSQVIPLHSIEKLQKAALSAEQYGKSFLSKTGIFNSVRNIFDMKKASAIGALDAHHRALDKQILQVQQGLENLRQSEDVLPGTKNLVNSISKYLDSATQQLGNIDATKFAIAKDFKGMIESDAHAKLQASILGPSSDGGFVLPRYTKNYTQSTDGMTRDANKVEIENAKGAMAFSRDTHNLLTDVRSFHKSEAAALYEKIDMEVFIPATSLIKYVQDTSLRTDEAIRNIFGPGNIVSRGDAEDFITAARMRFLEEFGKTSSEVRGIENILGILSGKFRHYDDIALETSKGRIDPTDVNDFLIDLSAKWKQNPGDNDILRTIAEIRVSGKDAKDTEEINRYIDEMIPAILKLSDAHRIRTRAWEKANSSAAGTDRFDTHLAASKVEELFDNVTTSDTNKVILDSLGQTEDQIAAILKQRASANKVYKENVGEILNSYWGRRIEETLSPRKRLETPSPLSSEEMLIGALLDQNRVYIRNWENMPGALSVKKEEKEALPYGVRMFNQLFPGSGKDVPEMAIDIRTGKLVKSGTVRSAAEVRHQALDLVSHAIGTRIRNGDTEWLRRMSMDHIRLLEHYKIINPEQSKTLRTYKTGMDKLAVLSDPPDITKVKYKIDKGLSHIVKLFGDKIKGNYLKDLLGPTVNIEQFVIKLLTDTLGKDIRATVDELTSLKDPLLQNIDEAKRIWRENYKTDPPENLETLNKELQKLYKDKVSNVYDNPLDILLEAVKDNPSVIDGLEDLILHYLAKVAVQKAPVKSMAGEASEKIAPLAKTVDIVKFDDALDNAIPALERILHFRRTAGGMSKETAKKIEDREAALKSLKDIVAYARTTLAKLPGSLRIAEIPKGMAARQTVGRMYNVVRGFVHPSYVIAEMTFLEHGTKHVDLMYQVLLDPRAMETFEKIIRNQDVGKEGMKAIWKAGSRAFKGILSESELGKEFKITNKQYADVYRTINGRFPPSYQKKIMGKTFKGEMKKGEVFDAFENLLRTRTRNVPIPMR